MKNKILIALALMTGVALAASSFTTHYNLEKSADGDTNWGSAYRSNMDTIDTQIYAASQTADNHISDAVGAHAATAISTTSGSLVCLSQITVQAYLDCLDGQLGAVTGGTVVTTNTVQTITASKTFSALQTFSNGLTLSGGSLTLPFSTGLLHSDGSGLISSSLLVNADVDASAAIAYSKLALSNSIVTGDIVDGTIVDADIDAAAAISRSKVASGTNDHVVINSGAGALSSEAQLSASRGGTGINASAASNGFLPIGNGSGFTLAGITGTANQVTVTNGSGTITLSTPQSIATTSDVTFDDITATTLIAPTLKASSSAGVDLQANGGTSVASFGAGGGTGWTFEGNVIHKGTVILRETGGGTDAVTLSGPASTTGYTITMPGSAPTANTALAYDGANYVWSSAGGWTTYSNENISASGDIASSTTVGQQVRRVTGNAAAVTASSTPFGAVGGWSDGLVIRLIGQSSSNTVTIVHNDAANGAILNGDCTLGAYDVIELQWDSTASRWIEIARSIK